MPDHELSQEQREFDMALNMVAKDQRDVDPQTWTHERTALTRAAAQDPVVARIFVNTAIKKAMCREAGPDRSWLSKVRPWWGHDEHFHVRLVCPPDSPECKPQPPVGADDGCGHELEAWLKKTVYPLTPSAKPKHNFARRPCQRSAERWSRRPEHTGPNGCNHLMRATKASSFKRHFAAMHDSERATLLQFCIVRYAVAEGA
jgi:murein endopeptidase